MMMGCKKCMKIGGVMFLALGIAFLGVDQKWWGFWNISWWTAVFIVMGVAKLAMTSCPDCMATMPGKKK